MRRAVMVASTIALFADLFVRAAQSQTSASDFAPFAGKWGGTTEMGTKILLQIEPSGEFRVESTRGNDAGMARIEGGLLIISFSNNRGQLILTKNGDTLVGNGALDTDAAAVTLARRE